MPTMLTQLRQDKLCNYNDKDATKLVNLWKLFLEILNDIGTKIILLK